MPGLPVVAPVGRQNMLDPVVVEVLVEHLLRRAQTVAAHPGQPAQPRGLFLGLMQARPSHQLPVSDLVAQLEEGLDPRAVARKAVLDRVGDTLRASLAIIMRVSPHFPGSGAALRGMRRGRCPAGADRCCRTTATGLPPLRRHPTREPGICRFHSELSRFQHGHPFEPRPRRVPQRCLARAELSDVRHNPAVTSNLTRGSALVIPIQVRCSH